jgi:hypothetical protein
MTTETDILPASISLTPHRKANAFIEEFKGSPPHGVKLVLETNITGGQTKQFGFTIPFSALTAVIDALAAAEQIAIDAGIIARVDDGEVQS